MTDTKPTPLPPEKLYSKCSTDQFSFKTTAELDPLDHFVGQDRAVEAVKFAIGMKRDGYNLFAFGPEGTGKSSLVKSFLETTSKTRDVPDDWAYINNFEEPHKPRALRLPPGHARPLALDMEHLIEDLRAAIPAAFESEEYRSRRQNIEDQFKEKHEALMAGLQDEAGKKNVAIVRTPTGVVVAPIIDGELIEGDKFQALSKADQEKFTESMNDIQEKVQETLRKVPGWEKEHRELVRELGHEVTEFIVNHLIRDLIAKYTDLPEVLSYLEEARQDIVHHAHDFLPLESGQMMTLSALIGGGDSPESMLKRYQVNVVVDNCNQRTTDNGETAPEGTEPDDGCAPVVYEEHPTLPKLLGRVEHMQHMGALITDFTMIKPGALHAANGGYLVMDARQLLTQPYAWDALKRALTAKCIRIEGPGEMYGFVST
ncbi:MAG: AAA family ATPase, partial [Rhodospirillales bacterium]|nr:AAA family ATPase [Rhodospirillales bacterium]